MTREEAIAFFRDMNECTYGNVEPIQMAIKALEQEPCEDVTIDKHYWKGFNNGIRTEKFRENKRQESCEDVVSRLAILNKIKEVCFSKEWVDFRISQGSNGQRDFIIKFIESLPSIQPKTGQWVKIEPYPLQMHDYECSECGHETDDNTENYCSNCGTKMLEPQERSEE